MELDVNTPPEPDLQRFTAQEISNYCAAIKLGMEVVPKTTAAIAVQIIRQLQSELAKAGAMNPVAEAGMEKMGFVRTQQVAMGHGK